MFKLSDDKPTAFFDVDDTLVMWWSDWSKIRNPQRIKSKEKCIELKDPRDNKSIFLKVHWDHVQQIKEHKLRGHNTVVWSAGGSDWAEEVVNKLELNDYVDIVISKPHWWYDDLNAEEILLPNLKRYIKYEQK